MGFDDRGHQTFVRLHPTRPVQGARQAEDIVLAASHAVFAEGALVPVINLVNGTSIVLEAAEGHQTLEFFHFVLARHDIVDAGGAPFETWRVEEPGLSLAAAA